MTCMLEEVVNRCLYHLACRLLYQALSLSSSCRPLRWIQCKPTGSARCTLWWPSTTFDTPRIKRCYATYTLFDTHIVLNVATQRGAYSTLRVSRCVACRFDVTSYRHTFNTHVVSNVAKTGRAGSANPTTQRTRPSRNVRSSLVVTYPGLDCYLVDNPVKLVMFIRVYSGVSSTLRRLRNVGCGVRTCK